MIKLYTRGGQTVARLFESLYVALWVFQKIIYVFFIFYYCCKL